MRRQNFTGLIYIERLFLCFIIISLGVYSQANNSLSLLPRPTSEKKFRTLYSEPNFLSDPIFTLSHGEIIWFDPRYATRENHLYDEATDSGRWRAVTYVNQNGTKMLAYTYDHWTHYQSLPDIQCPTELEFLAPLRNPIITAFKEPGFTSWRSCIDDPSRCIAWPRNHGRMFYMSSQLRAKRDRGPPGQLELFYKVQYLYNTHEDQSRVGVGWVPARYVQRKLERLSCVKRLPGRPPQLDPVTQQSLASLRSAEENSGNYGKFSRWTRPSRKKEVDRAIASAIVKTDEGGTSSISEETLEQAQSTLFGLKVDWDVFVGSGFYEVTDSLTQAFGDQAVNVGFGGISPLFLDLEVGGHIDYVVAVDKGPGGKAPDLMRMHQHILYTLPQSRNNNPIKMGIGWNLNFFSNAADPLAFNALAGGQFVYMSDSPRLKLFGKLGPVANSSGGNFNNYLLEAGIHYRITPSLGYDSWNITLESFSLKYTDKENRSTNIKTLFMGVLKTF